MIPPGWKGAHLTLTFNESVLVVAAVAVVREMGGGGGGGVFEGLAE